MHKFIVFAEALRSTLIKKGKASELKLLLKHIEVSKGAVTYVGDTRNTISESKAGYSSGGKSGGRVIPKTTIEQAIKDIKKKFQISKEDAIFIREVCEEVSSNDEIQQKVTANRTNILFLESYEPTVQSKVTNGFIERELWDQLGDPIYKDQGGIFSIMSKTVIDNIAMTMIA